MQALHYGRSAADKSPAARKVIALARFLATKHFRIAGWCSVSYGNISIVALLGLFFLCKPIYVCLLHS